MHGKWITATLTRRIYLGWQRYGDPAPNGVEQAFFTTTSEFSRAVEVK